MDFVPALDHIQNALWLRYLSKPTWISFWEISQGLSYSDALELKTRRLKHHFVTFVSTGSDEISYIARSRRDFRVVTGKIKVVFEEIERLEPPLSLSAILNRLSGPMRASFERLLGESVLPMTGNQYNAITSYLYSSDRKQHERLRSIFTMPKRIRGDNNTEIIRSHEKEAINLTLRISGLEDDLGKLKGWDQSEISTPDFLKSITTAPLREDQMIINDFECFGDWKQIQRFKNNVAVFAQGTSRVSIMNVNRTPTETAIGVDLMYFNQKFYSYIFVQYKRLTGDGKEKKFRLAGDEQFSKEIGRMSEAERLLESKQPSSKQVDYRLNREAFYFKFCQDIQEVQSQGLCGGMYLPKSYLSTLIEAGQKSVSYESVDRYLNNTHFIENVKSGFFGSSGLTSTSITSLISELIVSGKSIILAAHYTVSIEDDAS